MLLEEEELEESPFEELTNPKEKEQDAQTKLVKAKPITFKEVLFFTSERRQNFLAFHYNRQLSIFH